VSTAGITRTELLGDAKIFKAAAPVRVVKARAAPAAPGHCVEVIEMPDGSSRLSCFH
jgi:pilus assembly protein CpaB